MDAVLMIDGGSTHTRFTLWKNRSVVARTRQKAGASHAGAQSLSSVVQQEIAALQQQYNCRITEIYASGMITSESGLLEVPHICGPAGLDELARAVAVRRIPEICEATFHFVPGIRFVGKSPQDADLMRGEEVEILGAIPPGREDEDRLFVHFGSHNKLIVYREGRICRSVTTLGGELLWAVRQDTILKNSLGPSLSADLRAEDVLRGYRCTLEAGLTRALFTVRTQDIMEHAGDRQCLSYLYGAILGSDLQSFHQILQDAPFALVLYGREEFVRAAEICLAQSVGDPSRLRSIPYEESEWLSVQGMLRIRKRRQELGL